MRFKEYNTENAPHVQEPKKNKKCTISFRDSGKFILSKSLYEDMGKPTGILILQDAEYPTDFYLKASSDPRAFPLQPHAQNQFAITSNTMAKIMAAALKLPPPYSARFRVTKTAITHEDKGPSQKNQDVYCINTKSPITKKQKQ